MKDNNKKTLSGSGFSRRDFLKTSGVVAGAALVGGLGAAPAFAKQRKIKFGYVSPQTGPLAPFAEADTSTYQETRYT